MGIKGRWVSELRSSQGQIFPQAPRPAFTFRGQGGRARHCAKARAFGHRAQRYQDDVVLADGDFGAALADNRFDHILGPARSQRQIGDAGVIGEVHPVRGQPFFQRADHRVILVIHRAHDPLQPAKARDHVDKSHQITFELRRAVPRLKGKGGTPHQPEVGLKERGIELVRDGGVSQQAFGLERQTFDVEDLPFAEAELGVGFAYSAAHQPRL